MYAIGVDIGGTFTDIAVLDGEGILKTYKTSSTPADLGRGVKDGLGLAASDLGLSLGELLGDTIYFGHGTTAATNALIERKGSRTALITTRGFGDTLLIQRMLGMTAGLHEEQTSHYGLRAYPDPIVPPELIFEVTERLREWAEDHDRDIVQLAIAWTLADPAVTSSLVGARTPEQVYHNVKAADWRLTEAELAEIDEVQGDFRLSHESW